MANQILHYPETFGYRTYPAKNEIVTSILDGGNDKQIPTAGAVIEAINSTGHTIGDDQFTSNASDITNATSSSKKIPYDIAIKGYSLAATNIDGATSESVGVNTKIPSTAYLTEYSVPLTSIETNTSAAGSDSMVASTNYVLALINTLEKAVTYTTPVPIHVAPVSAQTPVLVTPSQDYDNKACDVVVTPTLGNTGAVYITTTDSYSNLNPIYPDPTNNYYKLPNSSSIYIAVDNVGDSVDLTISYRG